MQCFLSFDFLQYIFHLSDDEENDDESMAFHGVTTNLTENEVSVCVLGCVSVWGGHSGCVSVCLSRVNVLICGVVCVW